MDYSPILAPVVALVAWTLVMMVWMIRDPLPRDAAQLCAFQLTWSSTTPSRLPVLLPTRPLRLIPITTIVWSSRRSSTRSP